MLVKNRKRGAFTLVELLVAAGIIAMLLGLVAISYPSINEREQLTRAVDKLRTGFFDRPALGQKGPGSYWSQVES